MRWLKVVKCQPQQDCICRREQTHLTLVWDIVIAEGGELESPLLHASPWAWVWKGRSRTSSQD